MWIGDEEGCLINWADVSCVLVFAHTWIMDKFFMSPVFLGDTPAATLFLIFVSCFLDIHIATSDCSLQQDVLFY